jgi:putative tricarboxylic transport membrane protein
MAQQGKAGIALGLSLGASTIGGLLACVLAILLIGPVSRWSRLFGTPELFLLSLFTLSIIVSLSKRRLKRGLLSGLMGILMACMCADPTLGKIRCTFGFYELYDGLPMIACMIGMFAFPSIIDLVGRESISEMTDTSKKTHVGLRSILSGVMETLRHPINVIRSSIIGFFVGVLPGAGVDLAAFLSYSQAQTWSKEPEKFGHGHMDGVIAPEAANNSVTAGAIVPLMTLGVPGSGTTAVMMAAMTRQGVKAGPKVMTEFAPRWARCLSPCCFPSF